MRDAEIDQALAKAACVPPELPAELLKRIADSIEPSLRPVRLLPPIWVLASTLLVISGAVAALGAARAGFQGVAALGLVARLLIFGALALLASIAAAAATGEWVPGSRRRIRPIGLLVIVTAVLLAVFGSVFHDHGASHFVASGLTCLVTGLLHAAAAAFLGWWLLRRGWVVNPVSAGLLAGVLAGLAGVSMLELHCTNFQALHVILWHTLVVPVSGAVGAVLGWTLRCPSIRTRTL